MKIILEGCEGTGKTTLAKKLAAKYGLDYCHCSGKDPGDFEFYKQTARKENIVWDRHTIGELIYPDVFGRTGRISIEDAYIALCYARENEGKVFILTTDINEIRRRLIERGDKRTEVLEKLEWINNEFLFYATYWNFPIIDTSKMTDEEIFQMVEKPTGFKFVHK